MTMNNLYVHTHPTFEDKLKSLLQNPTSSIVELSVDNILDYLAVAKYIYDWQMDEEKAQIVFNLLKINDHVKYLIWDIYMQIKKANEEIFTPFDISISGIDETEPYIFMQKTCSCKDALSGTCTCNQ